MKNFTKFALTSAALLSFASAAPAFAHETVLRVSTAELATETGPQSVYDRIEAAAKQSCDAQFNPPYAIKSTKMVNRCIRRTVKGMVSQIDNPNLSVYAAQAQHIKTQKLANLSR